MAGDEEVTHAHLLENLEKIDTRVHKIEAFINEVRGGRKVLFYIVAGVGWFVGLLIAFWEQLFGSTSG